MANRREILSKMVVDEEAVFERLVDRASRIFKIDKQGDIVFVVPESSLSTRVRVAMALLARYFARELGFVDTDTVSYRDVAAMLDMAPPTVGARLSELRREGIAQSVGRGEWRVSILGVQRLLDQMGVE